MMQFNWSNGKLEPGTSLLSFTHHFCELNSLTIREFCKFFGGGTRNKLRTSTHIIDPELSNLDLEFTHGPMIRDHDQDPAKLFPKAYCVTDLPEEISTHNRFCPTCLQMGQHFAFQQLSWLTHCPIHEQPLQSHCGCETRPNYRLNGAREWRELCKCGQIRLRQPVNFNKDEFRRLERFLLQLHFLREQLTPGLVCVRMHPEIRAEKREVFDTYNLLRHILDSATSPFSIYRSQSFWMRKIPIDMIEDGVEAAIDALFEQYFVNTVEEGQNLRKKYRDQAELVSFLELQLLGNSGNKSLLHMTGLKEDLPPEVLGYARLIATMRFLEAVQEWQIDFVYGTSLLEQFGDHFGTPIGFILLSTRTGDPPTAFCHRSTFANRPNESLWTEKLARFLIKHVYFDSLPSIVVERHLNSMLAAKYAEARFASTLPESSCEQLDLFGTLGTRVAKMNRRT